MDNFDKTKKWVVETLPDATLVFKKSQKKIYTPFISMVVLSTKTQIYITEKWLKKKYSGHAE